MEFLTIERQVAYEAYRGMSFSPEKRADSTVKEFNSSLRSDYEELEKLAQSEPQKQVLETEFERYQQGYKSKYVAYLNAKSRTMSTMITGPANFPVRSNQKKMETERRRWEEFTAWQKKAFQAIRRKVDAAKTAGQIEADREQAKNGVMAYLLKEAVSVIACIAGETPYSPQLLKSALERRVLNAAKNFPDLALQAVNEINRMAQEKCKKDVFTPRHGIFTKLGAIKDEISKPKEVKETEQLIKLDWVEVVNNFEAERVQLIFNSKPSYEVRSLLKKHGFRWSPRFTAWQRQNTNNGLYNAKLVLKEIQPMNKLIAFE